MSRGRRNQDVTIREGTGEKNWYPIAGYAALAIAGGAYIALSAVEAGSLAGGIAVIVVSIGLLLGSLPVFWSLFKDAAYIRDTRGSWEPKWWYYIGVPFGLALTLYFTTNAAFQQFGFVAGFFGYVLTSVLSNVLYLYRRHKHIGVP